jgi:hypothetical protein
VLDRAPRSTRVGFARAPAHCICADRGGGELVPRKASERGDEIVLEHVVTTRYAVLWPAAALLPAPIVR